mmetsp:Transcript_103098/g.166190  ORF Transcript_103098/g.166190 Transcript_103098/m.166190 type:complete len:206 (-) Transcript_103098:916-1533(-)
MWAWLHPRALRAWPAGRRRQLQTLVAKGLLVLALPTHRFLPNFQCLSLACSAVVTTLVKRRGRHCARHMKSNLQPRDPTELSKNCSLWRALARFGHPALQYTPLPCLCRLLLHLPLPESPSDRAIPPAHVPPLHTEDLRVAVAAFLLMLLICMMWRLYQHFDLICYHFHCRRPLRALDSRMTMKTKQPETYLDMCPRHLLHHFPS